jgi:hypothetical protein
MEITERQYGPPRGGKDDNIKMDLKEPKFEVTNKLTQVRFQWRALLNIVIGFLKRWGIIS